MIIDNLSFTPFEDTPETSLEWLIKPESKKREVINNIINSDICFIDNIDIVDIVKNQIIVRIKNPLNAGERGSLLLDFEDKLKNVIDQALVVWVEPLGDKNSLRNLRGIEVKKYG